MTGAVRSCGSGYDRHLYDVGRLVIWPTVLVYECLGGTYGREVAGVLCETLVCGLGVDN